MDMKVFLEHLKAEGRGPAQSVQDIRAAEKAAAADPEVINANRHSERCIPGCEATSD